MRTDIDVNKFKIKLEEELSSLEKDLNSVGRKNPDNPKDWEAEPADLSIDAADENETADKMEEYEENTAVLKDLEIRYNEVKDALAKIEDGSYGICEVCNTPIETDRLEANPASKTCKAHMG